MATQMTITATHQETRAVLVMQGVTNLTESSGTWTVTIGGLTIPIDRSAWAIVTNTIAPALTSE